MNRTLHICVLLLLVQSNLAASNQSPPKTPSKIEDDLTLAPPASVELSGRIGRAIETCTRGRILSQDAALLVKPFAVREETSQWRCEFWGKWFTSAALAYRYRPDAALRAKLDSTVSDLLRTQTADGGITTYRHDREYGDWDTWGRKYTLLGLLAYYDLAQSPATLAAAGRHGDCVLEHFGPGRSDIATNGWWSGMAAGSILEPMVLLYRRTGDPRYLDFARYIVRSWEGPRGPDLVRKALAGMPVFDMFPGPDPSLTGYMGGGSSKAYEMMSCYEGLLELYRGTGEPKYFEAARKVFGSIRDGEITILGSGSSWERWCQGRSRQCLPMRDWMETCVTVTWMKLSLQLLRLTGDSQYADEIERTAYNALLGAQGGDGAWWSDYSPLDGQREAAPEQCGMHMNCCVANGPRGLLLLPAVAVMSDTRGPVVNLFESGSATVPLASGHSVRLQIRSNYPAPGPVEITVDPEVTARFTLKLRLPGWSDCTRVSVNGKAIPDAAAGRYLALARKWQKGDQVQLAFDFGVKVVKDPGGSGCVALTCGPLVLALDRALSKAEPGLGTASLRADRRGGVEARFAEPDPQAPDRLVVEVPLTTTSGKAALRLCDYASAGRSWGGNSGLRVWLPQPLNLEDPFGPAGAAAKTEP
jgi:hypothetical protein